MIKEKNKTKTNKQKTNKLCYARLSLFIANILRTHMRNVRYERYAYAVIQTNRFVIITYIHVFDADLD